MFHTRLGKLFFATFSALTAVALIASYDDARDERDLLYLQKERELLQVATQLDGQIQNSFDQVLLTYNAKGMSENDQTKILNDNLQPQVDLLSKKYSGIGLGIYSRKLDRNVAIGPKFDPSFLIRVPAPDAFKIYETGMFTSLRIEKSILWDGKPILAVHYPIYRNGEIIGHTFANTPIENIENTYLVGLIKRTLKIFGMWLLAIGFSSYVFYQIKAGRKRLISDIKNSQDDINALREFPEYMPILESVVQLRKGIEERNALVNWVVTQGNAGIIIVDKYKKIKLINEFASRYIGLGDPNALIGLEYEEWIEPVGIFDGEPLLIALKGMIITNYRADTGKGIIRLNASPIYDPVSGEIVAAACYFWDVTESEKASRLYKETTKRLLHLIEICPLAILELNKEGYITSLNSAMFEFYREYLPYTKEQLLGKSIREISSELGIEFNGSAIDRILSGQNVRNEHIVRLDRHFIVNGIPTNDEESGSLSGVLVIYHDISQYEQVKNEMARLEYLNAIGETASSVAHELRNPATTIRGFVQMLSIKSKDEYRDYFTIIIEELDRMNEIIEDFLSLSRNRYVPKTPYDLNAILYSLYPILSADALKNDIELVYDLCDKIRIVELNSKEIKQLVLNLARNGIEAMQSKGKLTICTKNTTNGVELIVSDTGPGIPPAILQKIFAPFYTSKKNGTGLGLSVSRNIVEGHNGTIHVDSEVGKGTVFTIYLPI